MNNEANGNRELQSEFATGRPRIRVPSQTHTMYRAVGNGYVPPSTEKGAPQFGAADLLPFVNALGRRWKWLLIGGVAVGMTGWLCGLLLWKDNYTASAQLLRQTSTHVMEILGDRELEPNTYASLLRAPELLQRVAAQVQPRIPAESLAKTLNIITERNSDVLLVAVSSPNQQRAVELANLYAQEAVKFTQELQTNAAARVSFFLSHQLAPLEAEITALNQMPQRLPPRPKIAPTPSPLIEKAQAARLELAELLVRYKDEHPRVREQQRKIASIEGQLLQLPPAPAPLAEVSDDVSSVPLTQEHDPAFIHAKLQSLENARLTYLGQQQAALSLAIRPPGTCQLLAPATLKEAIPHKRTVKVAVLAGFGGMLGFLIAGALIVLGEAVDPRLKTAADVQRVTHLPVVASAENLARMTAAEQKNWAFRAWTSLQGLLSPSPNQGFVCGITSSESGEGRSTWIRLLADAASQRGFRVLTIVARPPERNGTMIADAETELLENGASPLEVVAPANGHGALVANNVLSLPDEVTQKLIGPNPEPVVEIPLPGWVWNLERRKQWHAALRHWSQIDNIALLVELPPASLPETVLLAENLPNLIWLADGEKATAARTREQLATLRNARCHLAGAVLNRAPVSFWKNHLSRWVGCAVLILGLHGISACCQATIAGSHVFVQQTRGFAGVFIPPVPAPPP